ncbi:choline transporter [Endozoicomonas numazuensis]|uniref:Choline transporter n=1 Tax=Endozoicomonas numazuensis TaxID=1137799 RepID=A0A081NI68_9GAMM|nr:choline transporter [Endozoicomonas numazuensis]KEQ18141.1 choline transporter [Endozoicomonas numazuensis]
MTALLCAGILLTFTAIIFVLIKWGNMQLVGVTPVRTLTFTAILFTSGLDVGLIMFPLTEFAGYADIATSPEYAFSNPLAIEFGFWGFLIWGFYFLTCFYFCAIEPKVKFFEIPLIKFVNNAIIIGTCAFTGFLLLSNLPWYLPQIGDGETIIGSFYLIVFAVIAAAVYSSTSLRFVRTLSLTSTGMFLGLIVLMWLGAFTGKNGTPSDFIQTISLIGSYFGNIHQFALPLNDYHEFYLFWWFAWSIMIGQFTSRFVGGLKTWQVLAAMLIFPSIPIATWFAVLYYYHLNSLDSAGFYSLAMAAVGILFVVNSLDSLIRLYTDNLNLTVQRFGKAKYIAGNLTVMTLLTLLFQFNFLQIQWIGALVIVLFFICLSYILITCFAKVRAIDSSPEENEIDFKKIDMA